MTDDELQTFADQRVKLTYRGRVLTGTLISGFAAQTSVKTPYAVEWSVGSEAAGDYEVRRAAIGSAQAVESIELVDEAKQVGAEIEDAASDAQTPG